MQNQHRHLAAILFTDIVGYTSMMQQDEQTAVSVIQKHHSTMEKIVPAHHGEIHSFYGDGCLCIFSSATEAVRCAIEVQQQLQTGLRVPLRIGLHIGEIFFEQGKVMGDGVNIASRIQSLGQANTILFSKEIFDKLRNQAGFQSVSLGFFEFKNVEEPMEVFALTNEGLSVPRKEEMSGKLKQIQKKSTYKKWILSAVAILLIATSLFIYPFFFHATGFYGDKTIAVLPFENIGVPDNEEYIYDGIAQDIINNLSKISALQKVIGWFSVRNFKKTTKSIKQIGGELGVSAILTGTIQQHGDSIHIICELIEVNTNKQIWGDEFEYNSKELLSIQSMIAGQIVTVLKVNLTPEEKKNIIKKSTDNQEAYDLCLKGRFFWNRGSPAALDSAEHYYQLATQLDPSYALAYSGLADCYRITHRLKVVEAIPIAKDYALKAISLDSTLGEAWTTVGFIQSIFEHNWIAAKLTMEKAIRLNPNYPLGQLYYGHILFFNGSTEEGLKRIEKAYNLDPLSVLVGWPLGRDYYESRHYDLAIKQLQKILILDSSFEAAKPWLGLSLVQKGLYRQANDIFNQIRNLRDRACLLSYSYSISGHREEATAELTKALQIEIGSSLFFAISQFHFWAAQAYIGLGKTNEALSELENSFEAHENNLNVMKIDPALDPIKNEPRYLALLKKMHFN